ncbi:hypothetical protein pb186bvf_013597 [Paramecium bursaria]
MIKRWQFLIKISKSLKWEKIKQNYVYILNKIQDLIQYLDVCSIDIYSL